MKMTLFCCLAASLASAQAATIIGDTVLVRRELPSAGYITGPFAVTVVAGSSDAVSVSSGNNNYVNVESSSIFIGFGPAAGSGGGFFDHRIVVSDIDWFGEPNLVIGAVSATSDLPGFRPSMVTFDAHSVSLWHGELNWSGGQYVDIQLTPVVIPEPTSLALFLAAAGASFLLHASKGPNRSGREGCERRRRVSGGPTIKLDIGRHAE